SLPVVDAAAWQATIHDRLALLFSLGGLIAALAALRTEGRRRALLLGNGVAGLCLILAYNSKESAFFLAPVLGLLVLREPLGADRGEAGGAVRRLSARAVLLAVPLAYALFHNLRYLAQLRRAPSQAWSEHALSGDWTVNLGLASRHLLGLERSDSPLLAAAIWLALGIFAGALLFRARPGRVGTWSLVWLGVALLLSVLLTLRAAGQPPYYQYAPRAFLALLVVQASASRGGARPRADRWKKPVLAGMLAANLALLWVHSMPDYLGLLERSERFVTSVPALRECVEPSRGDSIELVTPLYFWQVYRFYLGSEDGFYRFLFPGWSVAEPLRGPQVRARAEVDLDSWAPADPETLYLVFDESFALDGLYHRGERLACSPVRGPAPDPESP
ncbi:MAG: hypothetical protein MI919_16600, partial [Holophagales bacterium]|nr:hypothetical protein [Holophagales bacterium]